jgi:hypothetical protein
METQPREPNASKSVVSRQQLTLTQLILWLLATCVVLAYEQWRLKIADAPSETFRWYFNLRLIFFAPLEGACLAAIVFCFWNPACRGGRFPSEPGHWFLLTLGVRNVCAGLHEVTNYVIGEERLNTIPDWLSVLYGSFAWVASTAVALIAARTFRREPLWKVTFIAIAISSLTPVFHSLLFMSVKGNPWFLNETIWAVGSRIAYSLPAGFMLWAVVAEWAQRRRDLLHWIGVAVLLLLVAAEWPAWLVWLRLFR